MKRDIMDKEIDHPLNGQKEFKGNRILISDHSINYRWKGECYNERLQSRF